MFKMTFLDRLLAIEWRDRMLVEYTNLRQGGISVKECSFKFTQVSKYATTLIDNSRDRMNKFVRGVSSMV